MKIDDIMYTLKKEFDIPEDQLELIISSFWKGFRYYLTSPLESKGKILLPHLGSFNIDVYSVNRMIEKIEQKEIKRTQTVKSLEFYKELAEKLKENERQSRKKNNNE